MSAESVVHGFIPGLVLGELKHRPTEQPNDEIVLDRVLERSDRPPPTCLINIL